MHTLFRLHERSKFRAIVVLLTVMMGFAGLIRAQEPAPPAEGLESAFAKRPYSPYAGRGFPSRVYWGDTHLHTAYSMDAGAFGARLTPPDAYRFARGEEFGRPKAPRSFPIFNFQFD